jgi:hypothetical protein
MPAVLRALLPGGRVVLRDPTCRLGPDLAALLRAHGFSAVRVRHVGTACMVSAERPIFGFRMFHPASMGARS